MGVVVHTYSATAHGFRLGSGASGFRFATQTARPYTFPMNKHCATCTCPPTPVPTDRLTLFIQEMIKPSSGDRISAAQLGRAYSTWWYQRYGLASHPELTPNQLTRRLRARGLDFRKTGTGNWATGYRLAS